MQKGIVPNVGLSRFEEGLQGLSAGVYPNGLAGLDGKDGKDETLLS